MNVCYDLRATYLSWVLGGGAKGAEIVPVLKFRRRFVDQSGNCVAQTPFSLSFSLFLQLMRLGLELVVNATVHTWGIKRRSSAARETNRPSSPLRQRWSQFRLRGLPPGLLPPGPGRQE